MMLGELGLSEYPAGDERVAILVGPNGSGKSNHLRSIATQYRDHRDVTILCNTAYDRFSGLRDMNRLSAGRGGQSPKSVIKRAVTSSLTEEISAFFQISATLEYCGYAPRFGFRVARSGKWRKASIDEDDREYLGELLYDAEAERDFISALLFLERMDRGQIVWIDARESRFEFSRVREFAAVLRVEPLLRKAKRIGQIHVHLMKEGGQVLELQHASSGELSLISSLLFLITTVPRGAIILIDEPENSLHPNWQREYIDKLLVALQYRGAAIVVATHAPLIVTGAVALLADRLGVYQIRKGDVRKLPIDPRSEAPSGIEEILWRAFDVVTPANHFVSEEIVEAIGRFEKNDLSKDALIGLVGRMEAESFEAKQQDFFTAIRKLIDKIEVRKSGDDGAAPADD